MEAPPARSDGLASQPMQRRPSVINFEQDSAADYRLYNLAKVIEVKTASASRAASASLSTTSSASMTSSQKSGLTSSKDTMKKDTKPPLSKSKDDSSSDMWKLWKRLQAPSAEKLHFTHVAHGGWKEKTLYFAAATSNSHVILFSLAPTSSSSQPTNVKVLPWFTDPNMRVASMSFKSSGKWLMIATVCGVVALVPVAAMLSRTHFAAPQRINKKAVFGRPEEITLLAGGSKSDSQDSVKFKHGPVVSCAWWTTRDGSNDYGLIATLGGVIQCVNLRSAVPVNSGVVSIREENIIVKLKSQTESNVPQPISNIQIGETSLATHLLIEVYKGRYHLLLLEHERPSASSASSSGGNETLLQANSTAAKRSLSSSSSSSSSASSAFQPIPLQRFPLSAVGAGDVRVQHTNRGAVLSVYDATTSKLEVYDMDVSAQKYPLFVYHLSSSAVTALHIANRLMFAVYEQKRLAIISNYHAANHKAASGKNRGRDWAVMQEFIFPLEKIFGSFQMRSRIRPKRNVTVMAGNSNSATTQTSVMTSSLISNNNTDQQLEEVVIWTQYGIYRCVPTVKPEAAFQDLLLAGKEKVEAEFLGKALGLDVFRLYETAADVAFAAKDYGRALSLYYLCDVKTSKMVWKFASIGKMDVVMSYLKANLHQARALSIRESRRTSHLLFSAYLYRLLISRYEIGHSAEAEAEFLDFLVSNKDFDSGKALMVLLNHGLVNHFLHLAHAKDLLASALKVLINRGVLGLELSEWNFLKEKSKASLLQNSAALFRALSPTLQLQLLIPGGSALPKEESLRRIDRLLPQLDVAHLQIVTRKLLESISASDNISSSNATTNNSTSFRDLLSLMPGGVTAASPKTPQKRKDSSSASHNRISMEDLTPPHAMLETFFAALLQLIAKISASSSSPSPISSSYSKAIAFPKSNDVAVWQEMLENQLRIHFKFYRTTAVLLRAQNHCNWSAAAVLYELLHDPLAAFECRLRGIVEKCSSEDQKQIAAADSAVVITLMSAALRSSGTDVSMQCKILMKGFSYLSTCHADVGVIERELLSVSNKQIFASPLSHLLEIRTTTTATTTAAASSSSSPSTNANDSFPLILPFTSQFYLTLLQTAFKLVESTSSSSSSASASSSSEKDSTRVSQEQLWNAIANNVGKEVDQRNRITLSPFAISQYQEKENSASSSSKSSLVLSAANFLHSTTASRTDFGDSLAFTCSHAFPRKLFFEKIIPQFRQRMAEIHPNTPLTIKVMISEYSRQLIGLACPKCVYNSLLPPKSKPWEL